MAALSQIVTASYPHVLALARKPHDQWSSNSALALLDKHGFIEREALGATIEVALDTVINPDAAIQSTAMDAVTLTDETAVLGGASFDIAEVTAPVKWSKKTESQNPAENQKVALVKSLITNAINSHDSKIETALFTTTTNGLLGFGTLISDAGTGTVGGIDSGSATYWRNQVGTPYESDGSNIEAIFASVYNACMKGTGGPEPKLMLSGSEAHVLYEGQLQTLQRFEDQNFKGGAKVLAFKNAFYGFAAAGDDHVYFLSPGALSLIMSKEYNRKQGEVREMDARNAFIMKIYTALQVVAKIRSRLGVCYMET